MHIYVTIKQAGKRKGYIANQQLELAFVPESLRDVIQQIVCAQVDAYNRKAVDQPIFHYLSSEAIEDEAETGKVGFGDRRNSEVADVGEAIEAAMKAFEDGIYRVFIEEDEQTDLDVPLVIKDGAKLTFIRFTMLAGRMW